MPVLKGTGTHGVPQKPAAPGEVPVKALSDGGSTPPISTNRKIQQPAAAAGFFVFKEPAGGYRDFLMNEARYARLTNEFPDRAEELFAKSEDNAKARYEHLLKLKKLYDEA